MQAYQKRLPRANTSPGNNRALLAHHPWLFSSCNNWGISAYKHMDTSNHFARTTSLSASKIQRSSSTLQLALLLFHHRSPQSWQVYLSKLCSPKLGNNCWQVSLPSKQAEHQVFHKTMSGVNEGSCTPGESVLEDTGSIFAQGSGNVSADLTMQESTDPASHRRSLPTETFLILWWHQQPSSESDRSASATLK